MVGIALGGGGARGFAHIGVLEELTKHIRITELAGTSMGAIIASYFAEKGEVASLRAYVLGLSKRELLSFADLVPPKHGLLRGRRLHALLTQWFGARRIEELPLPVAITATNLSTGEAAVFRTGPLVETLLASATIPGIFPAARIGDSYYVDGGIAMQVPAGALRARKRVAVELPIIKRAAITEKPSLIQLLTLVYGIGRERGQAPVKADLVLRPETGDFHEILAFHHARRFIDAGAAAVREADLSRVVAQRRTRGNDESGRRP